MGKITYENKVALNQNPNIPDINKVNDTDMNMIKNVVNNNETKVLLAVSSSAPATCDTGDIYFNTTDNLIYTATATDTWSSTGIAPTSNTIYLELTNQTAYAYDGTTLVSVGGGAGGGDSAPIGQVSMYAGSTAPDGFLMCDGSAVSRTTYSDLYSVIGTTYGTGDGSTTFNLPNIKSRIVVMLDPNDTDFDTLGETGGSKYLQAHQHQFSVVKDDQNTNSLGDGAKACNNTGYNSGVNTSKTSGNILDSNGTNTLTTGDSGNLQPYIVLNYIIKVQKLAGEVLSEQLPVGTEVDFDGSASDIPIGWEQVDTYSTSEVKTGDTWIDGKPIYRKVIVLQSLVDVQSSWTTITSVSGLNIENIISSIFLDNANKCWSGYLLRINNNNLEAFGSGITWNVVTVILEYTKTTD